MNRALAPLRPAMLMVCVSFIYAAVYAQQTGDKVIKDQAEYNAYITAYNLQDPAAKGAAMEAFTAQYPASVMKLDALEQAMAAWQQAGKAPNVEQVADRILQVDPNHIRALAISTVLKRARATQTGDARLTQELGALAERGLAALTGWTKPEGLSDEDFGKLRAQMAEIFNGAAGFAALQAKDFAKARDFYLKSAEIDPNNMQDIYQLAIAELEPNPPEMNGFWHVAKAVALARAQNNKPAADNIALYGKARYKRLHGSDDGWEQLVTSAALQAAPPANFSVARAPTAAELACKAVQENDPASLSFSDWEFVLQLRDSAPCNKQAADKVWAAIQTKQKQGAAKLMIPVKVIAAYREIIEGAITDENQSANKTDLRVTLEKPLLSPPQPGTTINIVGVITDYKPDPFVFVMTQGALGHPPVTRRP